MAIDQTVSRREFQAETKQLLDLMVHSIYTNKEIFLRELISNASDALDKIKFNSLTNLDLLEGDSTFGITLEIDEAAHSLTISDNGIGMTFDEVVENIGTIAKSGTKVFLQKLQEQEANQENMDLIGQFGVGFYSAFMVAEKVTLITRAAGAKTGVKWESTGDGTYTIEEFPREKRGSSITLLLNEEHYNPEKATENFLNRYTLQNLVQKYSDYIRYPIQMEFPKEEKPVGTDGKVIEGVPPLISVETKTLNSMTPLWSRNKSEITTEEYHQFYKNLFHDWSDPADIIHSKVEGLVEYTALLFIPSKAPFDLYSRDFNPGVKLYSRNVFIMDNCPDLLPEYLKFIRGLVDSSDFSLNISREILQHSKQLKLIGKNLEKSILKALETMLSKDRQKYEAFWGEFGKALKAGVYMDFQSKEKLQDLLLFPSSHASEGLTTLNEYLKRMPEGQTEIYYAAGKDRSAVEKLPQLEIVMEKRFEVLYLLDPVDEFTIDTLSEYQTKKFKSVSRGDLNLTSNAEKDSEKERQADLMKDNESLLTAIKAQLGEKVSAVQISNRLKASAVCLVSGDSGISLSMEHILTEMNQGMLKATRVLEINPDHELFRTLKNLFDTHSDSFGEYCELLYGQAQLMEGINLDDPVTFASKIAKLMVSAQK